MRELRRVWPFLALFGFADSAAAQVSGVHFSPVDTGAVPLTGTVHVGGTGSCAAVLVDFGDGSPMVTLSGAFPLSTVPHTYAVIGTYALQASSAACGGSATRNVNVQPAGTVSKVTVDPPVVGELENVKIKVEGSGRCGLILDVDTSSPGSISHQDVQLPENYSADYASPGSYTVKVTAVAPCTGSDTAVVKVVPPKLESATPQSVGPGSFVILSGEGLKNAKTLEIKLPNGNFSKLTQMYSGANFVGGQVDPDIQGVVSGAASYRVKGAGGDSSPLFDDGDQVRFLAKFVTEVLGPADVHVDRCSDDAGDNTCNLVHSGHANGFEILGQILAPHPTGGLDASGLMCGPGKSICANHTGWFGFEEDNDRDRYSVALEHGWVVHSTVRHKGLLDNGTVDFENDFNVNQSSTTLTVHYVIGATGGEIGYSETVVVTGPKGVSFK